MIEYKVKEFTTIKYIDAYINEYLDEMIRKGYILIDIKYSAFEDNTCALVIMKGVKDE